jgi:hypothetical protein
MRGGVEWRGRRRRGLVALQGVSLLVELRRFDLPLFDLPLFNLPLFNLPLFNLIDR